MLSTESLEELEQFARQLGVTDEAAGNKGSVCHYVLDDAQYRAALEHGAKVATQAETFEKAFQTKGGLVSVWKGD
ncbi:MAG: DUF4031 domain-containing protein [Nanoarchaeota archaeon]|nr:DUF4031 domain-containing protein [Nanoarchaeota archaeon]